MKIVTAISLLAAIAGATTSRSTQAQVVSQWNFNSNPADGNTNTGSLAPSFGLGSMSVVGGVTQTFASGDASGGSTDPFTGDDSGLSLAGNWAPQGTESGLRGVQFNVNTVGFTAVQVSWDQRHSNTSSRFVQFQYSTDGVNFGGAGLLNDGIFEAFDGGDIWYNQRSVDLTGISGAANNADFAFRIVQIFAPGTSGYLASTASSTYATTGTQRFDMVTVTNVPAPAGASLLVLAGMAGRRRRRH